MIGLDTVAVGELQMHLVSWANRRSSFRHTRCPHHPASRDRTSCARRTAAAAAPRCLPPCGHMVAEDGGEGETIELSTGRRCAVARVRQCREGDNGVRKVDRLHYMQQWSSGRERKDSCGNQLVVTCSSDEKIWDLLQLITYMWMRSGLLCNLKHIIK